ncbi:MAG: 6-phosphogluconolactonase, partial [Cyclobacteriaceae bacterium]
MVKYIYKTNEEVAKQFADYITKRINESEGAFHWSVSGGSTPKVLFSLLADEYADKIDWTKVHFYWGDERCVPPTDEDSNYKMTDERLFSKVPVPAENIHRILGENDPQGEAER